MTIYICLFQFSLFTQTVSPNEKIIYIYIYIASNFYFVSVLGTLNTLTAFPADMAPKSAPWIYIKPSDGEAPILNIWGMGSTLSMSLLLGPLWPGVVVLVRIHSKGEIESFNHLLCLQSLTCE